MPHLVRAERIIQSIASLVMIKTQISILTLWVGGVRHGPKYRLERTGSNGTPSEVLRAIKKIGWHACMVRRFGMAMHQETDGLHHGEESIEPRASSPIDPCTKGCVSNPLARISPKHQRGLGLARSMWMAEFVGW